MKKTILYITIVSLVYYAQAQKEKESKIPSAVMTAFQKSFPDVSKVKWDKEDGNYEANFTEDVKSMSATYNSKGALLETETDIDVKELPAAITAYVQGHYNGATIKAAAVITKPSGEKMYEAEVNGKDLMFNMQGKFLKEVKD